MFKTIGDFNFQMYEGGYPVWIEIEDARGNKIRFTHKDLSDLKHLVNQAKKVAISFLAEGDKHEA